MAEITEYRISDLTAAASLNDSDSLEISQEDAGELTGHISKRTTMLMIANRIATIAQYTSSLQTTSKTLTGAINELKGLISLIPQFSIQVVNSLPVSDISTTTIYLTPSSNPETQNSYDEFIYVNNTWEQVGTTAVDLSAYYTKTETDTLLSAKANASDVTTALELKENTADLADDVTDIIVALTDEQTTAPGNPVTLTTVQEGGAKSALVTFAPKQSGTGDPSPTNIRPISGWDGLSLFQCKKNMFNKTDVMSGYKLTASGGTTSGSSFFVSDYIYLPEGDYIAEKIVGTNNGYGLFTYDENKTKVRDLTPSGSTADKTFTIQSGEKYIRLSALLSRIDEVQLELGSTATTYEPYQGTTYTATFPETIMGGSYDFVSGVGQKKYAKVKISSLTITKSTTGVFNAFIEDMKDLTTGNNIECDAMKYGGTSRDWLTGKTYAISPWATTSTNRIAFVGDGTESTVEDLLANIGDFDLCYEVANPTPISLTPADVNLLKGSNTVWTDGDTVQVKYSELPNGNLGAVIDYIKKLEARIAALES